MIQHPFPPLYDKNSGILILGSFPSVKSRETSAESVLEGAQQSAGSAPAGDNS